MKRMIKATRSHEVTDVIFENEYFTFGALELSNGVIDISINSKGLADDYNIYVSLQDRHKDLDSDRLLYSYAEVKCIQMDVKRFLQFTPEEARQIADVLYSAADFAERVNNWLENNQ